MRACLLLVCVVAPPAFAEPISLSLSPEVRCLEERSLTSSLASAHLEVGPTGTLDVDLSPTQDGIRLRARRSADGRLLVRTVPVRRGCDGIELAVVTLIREWAGPALPSLPEAPRDAGTRTPPPSREPPAARPPVSLSPEPFDAGLAVEPPPARADVTSPASDAGPLQREEVPDAGLPAAPPVAVVDGGAGVAVAGDGFELRVGLAGGVGAVAGAPVTPQGAVSVDLGAGGWGGLVELSLFGDAALAQEGVSLSVQTQALTLAARRRFTARRVSLDLALGLRGTRLVVTTALAPATTLVSGGPVALATGWLQLVDPVHLFIRLAAGLRLPAEALVVVNGPTFSLGVAQLSAVAGLAVAWP